MSMTPPLSKQLPTHFGLIDAMRGLAALCVVVFHYTRFYMPTAEAPLIAVPLEGVAYSAILAPVYLHGQSVVLLFWVISGFVFAHVYLSRDTGLREFAVARFARLYPLHFVTLILVMGMQFISMQATGHWQIVGNNDLWHFGLQVFLMDSALTLSNGNSFNAPIWSVSAEVFIYIVFFVSLSFVKRRPLAGSLVLAALSFVILSHSPKGLIVSNWTLSCGVFFFAGSACYAMFCRLGKSKVWGVVALLGFAAAAGAVWGHFDLFILATCCLVVVTLAALEQPGSRRGRLLRFLGDISYSLYLVHMPLQIATLLVVDMLLGGGRGFADSLWTLPIFLFVSIWVAYVTNRFFEKPVGKWLRLKLGKTA